MADPISVASGVVALVAFGLQTSKTILNTIESRKNQPKTVRDLKKEIEVLTSLPTGRKTLNIEQGSSFRHLEILRHSPIEYTRLDSVLPSFFLLGPGRIAPITQV